MKTILGHLDLRFQFFALLILISTQSHATDISFLIFDNKSNDLLNEGHLEEGSVFLNELYEAGLYLGKRLESDQSLRIGVTVEYGFGGTGGGGPVTGSEQIIEYLGEQVTVYQPAAVEHLNTPDNGTSCSPHMNIKFDTHILFDGSEYKSYYPPGTIRGTALHEFLHGLGVTSERIGGEDSLALYPDGIQREGGSISTVLSSYDLLISSVENSEYEFEVGGDTVSSIYGRKVRLREFFQRGNFSHVGQSSPHTIRADGIFKPNTQSSILGEYGDIDVGTSVLSSSRKYTHPDLYTAIDIALLKDLGYPTAPLNPVLFFNSQAREDQFPNEFTKAMSLPLVKVSGDSSSLYSVYLMWESAETFSSLGIATTGETGILRFEPEAADILNSAEVELVGTTLHIPNIEVYADREVSHFSAEFNLTSQSVPYKFELVNLQPISSNTSTPTVAFVHCEGG